MCVCMLMHVHARLHAVIWAVGGVTSEGRQLEVLSTNDQLFGNASFITSPANPAHCPCQ